ncbi:MAG: hypothetical protein LKH74_10520 [Levilactobacillus sp.]|uniref:hypothetical protein n=1 Tax=Levilactobacillus sp. TaxID=2767919 RepID=UPI002589C385|nr:hypothetical protein [Levilactobacillus sp.]MCI1554342.1 hypothetical protein [Levilactobacillus sp.]MCI1599249.1 hypothetical protein [Levilactobacillus sp.]MCI1605753.1 hypothetical protein [Levilactobacillus sp.]
MTSEEKKLLSDFQASAAYRDFSAFPDELVMQTLVFYLSEISSSNKDFHEWTTHTVLLALKQFAADATQPDMPNADDFLYFSYAVIKSFLQYLVGTGTTKIQEQDLTESLDQFEKGHQLSAGQLENDDPAPVPTRDVSDPDLPEWRAYRADSIQRYTAKWVAAYVRSPGWRRDRNADLTQDTLELAVEQLSEQAYDTYRKTPKSWTKKVLSSILCGYFVSNLDLTAAELGAVIPVIGHVMRFAAEQGWLNAKKAENYQRYLNAIAPKAVAQAQDPNNFGPAKQAIIQMRTEGVDTTDEAAIQAFMDQVNAQGGLNSAYEGGARLPDGRDLTAAEFQALLDDDDRLLAVAVKFDPDPQADYLTRMHVTKVGDRHWHQADAQDAHKLSLLFGLRLWLLRDRYPLEGESWQLAFKVMDALTQLADMLYSQQLVMLDECPPVIWEDFAQWIRQAGLEPQQLLALLTALIHMLVDDHYLPAEEGKRIIAVLHPANHQQGNVISMKAARKKKRQ